MKNLANCTPREFLAQTVKIKKAASAWLKITNITNIRHTKADITDDMTAQEKREAQRRQAMKNFGLMYDALAEEHPEETLELLALMCFVEPDKVDEHPMSEYLAALNEMIESEAVIGFFLSLAKLGRAGIFRL